jgi:soluble lytic murein transglycosylase-like protein
MAKRAHLIVGAVLALLVAAGCGLTGNHDNANAGLDPAVPTVDATSAASLPDALAETTTPPPSPTSAKPTSTKKPKHKATSATPTADPDNFQLPSCATRDGKLVSKTKAKAALNAAAAVHYWPKTAPNLLVPADLVRSVAWHESGWQSNIVNCDGGYGLMQVMPNTVTLMNNRFEKSYDVKNYQDNAKIGANYLAYSAVYIGHRYFGDNYDLSTSKCKSATSWCLLNTVIAAYHSGVGAIDRVAADKDLPDQDYVGLIRANMRSCDCDKY